MNVNHEKCIFLILPVIVLWSYFLNVKDLIHISDSCFIMLLKFVYVFCVIFMELHDVIVCGLMRCLTYEVWLDFYDCTVENQNIIMPCSNQNLHKSHQMENSCDTFAIWFHNIQRLLIKPNSWVQETMISIWKSKVLFYHLTEAKAKLIKIITVDVVTGFLGTYTRCNSQEGLDF